MMVKSEIDFIITQHNSLIPIEVKFTSSPKIPIAIKRFQEKYPVQQSLIITRDYLANLKEYKFIPVPLLGLIETL